MWRRAQPYLGVIPQLLILQLASTTLTSVVLAALRRLGRWALASQGRVAVTTGDFAFLLTSWQGWVFLLGAVAMLYVVVGLDLNAKVVLAGQVVRGQKVSPLRALAKGLVAVRSYVSLQGLGVVLYVSLLAPTVGIGVSLSLTESLQIPSFVSSVIYGTPVYFVAYAALVAGLGVVGFLGLFVLHGVALDGMGVAVARRQSSSLMRAHWVDFLLQSLRFAVLLVLWGLLGLALLVGVPLVVPYFVGENGLPRMLMLFGCFVSWLCVWLFATLAVPFSLINSTRLYEGYRAGQRVRIPAVEPWHPKVVAGGAGLVLLLCLLVSYTCDVYFDELFPAGSDVRLIAHRAGGSEGPENTVAGLRDAAALGAWGSEIDIQRTSDGAYVVNHDNTFKRTAGVRRRPSQMTLAEVRELSVDGEPVPTFEEMLAAAREEGVVLFVEFKGSTADRQMADDAVAIARAADMLDSCVFISLKYKLIDYVESTYPEAQTGFLAFASYGNTAALNCDYLALEEQASTFQAIEAIHEEGKQDFVWTVNDEDAQRYFLCSDADAIITDEVAQAQRVRAELERRSDFERVADAILGDLPL